MFLIIHLDFIFITRTDEMKRNLHLRLITSRRHSWSIVIGDCWVDPMIIIWLVDHWVLERILPTILKLTIVASRIHESCYLDSTCLVLLTCASLLCFPLYPCWMNRLGWSISPYFWIIMFSIILTGGYSNINLLRCIPCRIS